MGDNVFQKIGHGIETVGKDIGHVIVEGIEFPDKAAKVINTVVKDVPQFKAELLTLITDGKSVLVDAMDAASAKGLNWTEDLSIIAAIEAFAAYFKNTFLPAVEAAYNEVNTDVLETGFGLI